MTTVAYRDGIIACDSCFSFNKAVDTLSKKIVRLRSGALLGQAGQNDARPMIELFQNVKTAKQLPSYEAITKLRVNFLGLLILPNKTIWKVAATHIPEGNWTEAFDDDLGIWEVERDFSAIGTGGEFAIGAMEMGASARQAVRVGCRNDTASRLPVHTLSLLKDQK